MDLLADILGPIVALEPDKFDRAQENGHCDSTKLSLNNRGANLLAWYRINNLLIKTESDIEQGLSCPMLGSITRINMYTLTDYTKGRLRKKRGLCEVNNVTKGK